MAARFRRGLGMREEILRHAIAELCNMTAARIDDDDLTMRMALDVDELRQDLRVALFIQQVTADNQIEVALFKRFARPVHLKERNRSPLIQLDVDFQKALGFRMPIRRGHISRTFVEDEARHPKTTANFQDSLTFDFEIRH